MSDAVAPFEIAVPQSVLDDLQERLARTRWPDQIEGTGWDYGTELAYLKELCAYWQDGYDWRKQEGALNSWPQFTTEIDGQNLHFIHARSKHGNALPLLITHGWPGSIVEFQKILPMLTDPEAHGGRAEDAFHVVAPSMPGYGFSGPTNERGWDTQRIAEAEIELMKRLGYERYAAQGGDWGAIVTVQVGRLDPEHCVGIHLNMIMALPPEKPAELDATEKERLAYANDFQAEGTGYQAIQGTKPQTLAYGLTDSPTGLAGWIVEKFRAWGDTHGDVESVFSKDELLTNIMVYWVTGTINSSMRLYYEMRKSGRAGFTQGRVDVPTGCASFPKELYNAPREWAERHYNVTHYERFAEGGHFAAMEQPALLAADMRKFFGTVRVS
jgi:microsomal epoxide hydrolase